MLKLLVLRGFPASGKSTYALDLISKDKSYIRVNRDSIREMLSLPFSKDTEKLVKKYRDNMIFDALKSGYNVISDDTNLSDRHINHFRHRFGKMAEIIVKDDFMNVPLDVLLERNRKREKSVPEKVIIEMFDRFGNKNVKKEKKEPVKPVFSYDENLPFCIICDIDGTVALHWNRSPFEFDKVYEDVINVPVMEMLSRFDVSGLNVLFVSGREGTKYCRKMTELWLCDYLPENINKFKLYMRNEGDMRKDAIIKEEIYNEYIKGKYNVLFVLDDRNQTVMKWRDLGLSCFQVADGNF